MEPKILLDGQASSFQPGQLVTGQVILNSKKSVNVNELTIQMLGKATAQWNETYTQGDIFDQQRPTQHTITFGDEQIYIDKTISLIQKTNDNTLLSSGTHQFPFQFQLPPVCAPSYKSDFGNISYCLIATIDRPSSKSTANQILEVDAPFDLNSDPNSRLPINVSEKKTLSCCLCCKYGDLATNVSIKQQGLVAGMSVPICVEVENQSSKTVIKLKCELTRKTLCHGGLHKCTSTDVMAKHALKVKIGPRQCSTFVINELIVPKTAKTLINCRIIESSYNIKVSIVPSGCLISDLVVNVPVKIGEFALVKSSVNLQKSLPHPSVVMMPCGCECPNHPRNSLRNKESLPGSHILAETIQKDQVDSQINPAGIAACNDGFNHA